MSQMEEKQNSMVLQPIARVENDIGEMGRRDWHDVVSRIVFYPGFEDALDGIEEFSHIVVIYWMHRSAVWEHSRSRIHPQGRPELPLVGILVTRSPVRPNPLGMTVTRLLERSGNTLKVSGLDALDGTPVVDIKPYLPGDLADKAVMPDWVHKLHHCRPK